MGAVNVVGLLGGSAVTDEQRQANNARNSGYVVAGVLLTLLLYGYLFTRLYQVLNVPSPEAVAYCVGLGETLHFEPGHYLAPRIHVTLTDRFGGRERREILLIGIAISFVAVYFARVGGKRAVIATSFLVLITVLYGARTAAWFLAAHLLVYLSFHPRAPGTQKVAFGSAWLMCYCMFAKVATDLPSRIFLVVVAAGFAYLCMSVYQRGASRLLQSPRARWFRRAVSYCVPLIVWTSAIHQGLTNDPWYAPAGLVLFFWQWLRLILYGVDYEDGSIPEDQPLSGYLSTFMTPAVLPSWGWGIIIGQGYAYQSSRFLCKDKNVIAKSGIQILGVALLYMVFGMPAFDLLIDAIRNLGVVVYPTINVMLDQHLADHDVTTATVLLTTCMHLLRYLCRYAGLFHFLVGVWRLMGFDVAPHIHYPLLATNLATLWARLLFHYREFIVRVFYYPTFLRLAGWPRWTRVLVATLASAGFGNWLFQPMVQPLLYRGMRLDVLLAGIKSLPFFVLLAVGIFLADVWAMWRGRRRKPWTRGPLSRPAAQGGATLGLGNLYFALDVLFAYLTIQYFMLISVFYYASEYPNHGQTDFWIIALRGVGIQ